MVHLSHPVPIIAFCKKIRHNLYQSSKWSKIKTMINPRQLLLSATATLMVSLGMSLTIASPAFAATIPAGCPGGPAGPKAPGVECPVADTGAGDVCGGKDQGNEPVKTSINIGCKGKGNPILDLSFAIIRFLSNGAGLVIIGSLIYAGIQYSGSRGDAQSTAMAVNRIQSTVFALLLFIFAYAIINYLVPGTFLR